MIISNHLSPFPVTTLGIIGGGALAIAATGIVGQSLLVPALGAGKHRCKELQLIKNLLFIRSCWLGWGRSDDAEPVQLSHVPRTVRSMLQITGKRGGFKVSYAVLVILYENLDVFLITAKNIVFIKKCEYLLKVIRRTTTSK